LGFHIGMSHKEAIRAACEAFLHHQAKVAFFSERGGKCVIDDAVRDPKWAAYSGWSATADGFQCALFETATVYVDFSEKDGHLTRIAAYCPTFDL